MTTTSPFLKTVYEGWDSHQQALMHTVTPLDARTTGMAPRTQSVHGERIDRPYRWRPAVVVL